MATEKQKKVIKLSPRGFAVFPHLVHADTKFDPIGSKGTKLFIKDGPAAKAFVKLIDAEMDKSLATATEKLGGKKKAKQFDPPYSYDEERGGFLFTFKRKAGGTVERTGKPWEAQIALYDNANRALDTEPWGGSEITVAYEIRHTMSPKGECGVKLSPEAVQVHVLVAAGSGRSAEQYGFQASEPEEVETETPTETEEETDGDY